MRVDLLPAGHAERPRRGHPIYIPKRMEEPLEKRAVAFFDGQNLYRHAKDAFGHHFPNYDPIKLFDKVCAQQGWKPFGVRFYTGTPSATRSPMWHGFWSSKLLALRRAGVFVYSREIRHRQREYGLPDGSAVTISVPQEKGIDIHLALDVMRLALTKQFDVAAIFSQDQDLAELVDEVKEIGRTQDRWVKLACVFPAGPRATTKRGIDKTDWVRMDQTLYDGCLDSSITAQPRIALRDPFSSMMIRCKPICRRVASPLREFAR